MYEPTDSLEFMEDASYFDKELIPVVWHLAKSDIERFSGWQLLVNEAARVGAIRSSSS